MTVGISSSAFKDGERIPTRFTCHGADVNPPIEISGIPDGATSLALIVDDPDAAKEPRGTGRTWDHWILVNIPPDTTRIPEGFTPPGAIEGTNDFGGIGYGGPCPPTFQHRYYFKLYALDSNPHLEAGLSKAEAESAMDGHIIGSATLTCVYEQPRR